MSERPEVKEINYTRYECPVCKEQYASREAAEQCAAPHNPKFAVGDWVVTKEYMTFAVPGGDEFSREYEHASEGTPARISRISDENSVWDLKREHPEFVYSFDKGLGPLTFYAVRERCLERFSPEHLDRIMTRLSERSKDTSDLEEVVRALSEV